MVVRLRQGLLGWRSVLVVLFAGSAAAVFAVEQAAGVHVFPGRFDTLTLFAVAALAALTVAATTLRQRVVRRDHDRVVQAALDQLTEGVVVANAAGEFLLFNQAAERILGIGLMHVAPTAWSATYGCHRTETLEPFPSEDLPLARALRGEITNDVHVFIQNREIRSGAWISISGAPLHDARGALLGGVVAFRDVTDRVRQDQIVRRLSSVVEQTADSVFITDRQGVIEYVNPAFVATTGYSSQEAIGSTPRLLKSGRYDASHYRGLWETILRGEVYRSTTINRKKSGEEYHAEQTITPLKQKDGQITHFVSLVKDVTDRVHRQAREIEMGYAARVQARLYPSRPPDVPGVAIAGTVLPSEMTGGDYFDCLRLPDGAVGLVLGDVCGHGLASALIMAATRAYLRSAVALTTDPGELLSHLNEALHSDVGGDGHYVTLLFASLDPATGRVAYASAGHTPGYTVDRAGQARAVLEATGIPLGLFPGSRYETRQLALDPGEMLVLLTDGVTEAESPDGRLFGADGALSVIQACRAAPVLVIAETVRQTVADFTGKTKQADDVTILLCRMEERQ